MSKMRSLVILLLACGAPEPVNNFRTAHGINVACKDVREGTTLQGVRFEWCNEWVSVP